MYKHTLDCEGIMKVWLISFREHLMKKKMFSFGHCPNEGGGRALPELKNTLYIFLYDGRKRCTSCPKEGEGGGGGGGEVIWAMPERKHSFLNEVFPKMIIDCLTQLAMACQLSNQCRHAHCALRTTPTTNIH